MEGKLYSGNYKPEENKTCDECGIEIGDYTIHEEITRCVDCWIEFEIKQFDDAYANGECSQEKKRMNSMMKKFTKKPRVKVPNIGISPYTQKILNRNREVIEMLEQMQRKPWICRLFCKYRPK